MSIQRKSSIVGAALLCLAFVWLPPTRSSAQFRASTETWGANSSIYSTAIYGNKAYIGGAFTRVGPNVGFGVPVSRTTGVVASVFPKVNNTVNQVVSDGANGWFVAGPFTDVGGSALSYLAHIRSDGAVDTGWTPNPNNSVDSMALSPDGLTLYITGSFTSIGGQARQYIAAVNTTNGNATSWNPAPDASVASIVATGTSVYVGGNFTTIGGAARNYVAELDATTALATTWNPNLDAGVSRVRMNSSGSLLYVMGGFSSISGDTRNYLGAIDISSASATAWDPEPNSTVTDVVEYGSYVFCAGGFSTIGGGGQSYLARLDKTTGLLTAWDATPDSNPSQMLMYDNTLYLVGQFTLIGGEAQSYVAALDPTTALATSWDPAAGGVLNSLAVSANGSMIYLGGDMYLMNTVARNYLAEIDLTTGQATTWNPNLDNTVTAIAVPSSGSPVYVGGDFSSVGGDARSRLAAIDAASGSSTSWDPGADDSIAGLAIRADGSAIFAVGAFSTAGGAARLYAAEIDAATGLATAWTPDPIPFIARSVLLSRDESKLFVGTGLTTFAPGFPPVISTFGNVETLDANTGTEIWQVRTRNHVYALAESPDGQTLYIGGGFAVIAGVPRNRLGAVDIATQTLLPFDPDVDSTVRVLHMDPNGNFLYVGGAFTSIGGTTRNYLAGVNLSDGLVNTWDPNANGAVYALATDGNASKVVAGGDFWAMGSDLRSFFVNFTNPTVQFSRTSSNITENGGTAVVAVSLSTANTSAVTVNYSISGTASSGSDYTLAAGTTTIPAGSLTANISVPILDDMLVESSETVVLTLSNPRHATLGGNTVHTITISDDDVSGGGGSSAPPESTWRPLLPLGMTIDNGAPSTAKHSVSLQLLGGANVTRMSISNLPDMSDGFVEPFQATKSWDLCWLNGGVLTMANCPAGKRTVYARLYTPWGLSSDVTASIEYSPTSVTTQTVPMGALMTNLGEGFLRLNFPRDLYPGMRGEDVRTLQRFLNANGFTVDTSGPGSKGQETTLYGAKTRDAVRRFQRAFFKEIVVAAGLKAPTGTFGPFTRKFVNALKLIRGASCTPPSNWCY